MKSQLLSYFFLFILSEAFAQGKLLFKTGFEADTRIETSENNHLFSGTDHSTGYSWDKNEVPGVMQFVYIAGRQPENYISTRLEQTSGRNGEATTALYMGVKADFPDDKFGAVSRNEFSFFPAGRSFNEGYVSLWMKLQDNLLDIAPKTKSSRQLGYYGLDSWRMLMEIKEPDSGIALKGRGTNNYRISFFIARDSLTNKMYWLLRGEMPQPVRKIDWESENRNIEVPIGEWFKMEAYYKKGKEDGRIWWAVNGQEIADYRGRTEHPDNPLPVKFWSFFKLYQDEAWFQKGEVFQWVDDLEFWSSWPAKNFISK